MILKSRGILERRLSSYQSVGCVEMNNLFPRRFLARSKVTVDALLLRYYKFTTRSLARTLKIRVFPPPDEDPQGSSIFARELTKGRRIIYPTILSLLKKDTSVRSAHTV